MNEIQKENKKFKCKIKSFPKEGKVRFGAAACINNYKDINYELKR